MNNTLYQLWVQYRHPTGSYSWAMLGMYDSIKGAQDAAANHTRAASTPPVASWYVVECVVKAGLTL